MRKAAPTFAGKPSVISHRPLIAADHERQITVGAIDNNVRFDAPYLRAPLTVWDGVAIAGIDADEARELSCGYRYDASDANAMCCALIRRKPNASGTIASRC